MNIEFKIHGEQEWKVITEEEVENKRIDFGIPLSWKARLNRGETLYSDDYRFKLQGITEKVYDESCELTESVLFNNFQDENWKEIYGNSLDTMIEMMGGYATNYKGRLYEGEIISFPLGQLRLKSTKTCPLCGFGFRGMGSLSRRDNQTEICSLCGDNEAFMDLIFEDEVDIKFLGKKIATVSKVLYHKFQSVSSLPIENAISLWATYDLQVLVTASTEIKEIEQSVIRNGYEDISEWIKERMRSMIEKEEKQAEKG